MPYHFSRQTREKLKRAKQLRYWRDYHKKRAARIAKDKRDAVDVALASERQAAFKRFRDILKESQDLDPLDEVPFD